MRPSICWLKQAGIRNPKRLPLRRCRSRTEPQASSPQASSPQASSPRRENNGINPKQNHSASENKRVAVKAPSPPSRKNSVMKKINTERPARPTRQVSNDLPAPSSWKSSPRREINPEQNHSASENKEVAVKRPPRPWMKNAPARKMDPKAPAPSSWKSEADSPRRDTDPTQNHSANEKKLSQPTLQNPLIRKIDPEHHERPDLDNRPQEPWKLRGNVTERIQRTRDNATRRILPKNSLATTYSLSRNRRRHGYPVPRPPAYGFDPVTVKINTVAHSGLFPFLHPSQSAVNIEYAHANPLDPASLGVPWPTLFPGSIQSKHWRRQERRARDFLRGVLAEEYRDKQIEEREKEVYRIADAATTFTANVFAAGHTDRGVQVARIYAAIFLLDDATDRHSKSEVKIPDYVANALAEMSSEIRNVFIKKGRKIADTYEALVHRVLHPTHRDPSFNSLDEYVKWRVEDLGLDFMWEAMEFAGDFYPDTPDMDRLRDLASQHFALTNDLYSYEKEKRESPDGVPVFNALTVLQRTANMSFTSAQARVRRTLWRLEWELNREYFDILREKEAEFHRVKKQYAKSMVAAVAGHLFYAATCRRYARFFVGSHLTPQEDPTAAAPKVDPWLKKGRHKKLHN